MRKYIFLDKNIEIYLSDLFINNFINNEKKKKTIEFEWMWI